LSFKSIDNVHGRDCLASGVLSVGDSIADHMLQEDLEHTTSLIVDGARNTLHTTTTSQTSDGGLGNTLDIVTELLAVSLGSGLALASLTSAGCGCCWCSCRHDCYAVRQIDW